MKKIIEIYKKMSVDDALIFFAMFGVALMVFAFLGYVLHALSVEVSDWLCLAGLFVDFVMSMVIFARNGFFLHDITDKKNK